MWNYLWPILIVVGANAFYNISTKSTPQGIDPFASLTITYLVAAALSLLMFFVTGEQKNLLTEFSKANWTSFLLGISVVALEFGYISIYRAGWKVSTASLVANISLACVLLFVGILLYKEALSFKQLAGIAICVFGLILMSR